MSNAMDRKSVRLGMTSGLVLGALASGGFAYANLGPSSKAPTSDDGAAVVAGYVIVAVGFLAFGYACRARRLSVGQAAIAGAVTGLVTLVMVAGAILLINNLWLSTVARQPDKIYGLAHNHVFHTMRAYLNGQVALGLVVLPPFVAAGCALLAATGAYLRRPPPRGRVGLRHQPA